MHDTRALTSRTLKKLKKSLETTVWIMRTAGPKGATQHIWADDESRQTLIARGPQGGPPGCRPSSATKTNCPKTGNEAVKSKVRQLGELRKAERRDGDQ